MGQDDWEFCWLLLTFWAFLRINSFESWRKIQRTFHINSTETQLGENSTSLTWTAQRKRIYEARTFFRQWFTQNEVLEQLFISWYFPATYCAYKHALSSINPCHNKQKWEITGSSLCCLMIHSQNSCRCLSKDATVRRFVCTTLFSSHLCLSFTFGSQKYSMKQPPAPHTLNYTSPSWRAPCIRTAWDIERQEDRIPSNANRTAASAVAKVTLGRFSFNLREKRGSSQILK